VVTVTVSDPGGVQPVQHHGTVVKLEGKKEGRTEGTNERTNEYP
jgi:hypothetical protein